MSEWIAVKERLPDLRISDKGVLEWPSEDVLVVVNDEHKSMYVSYYKLNKTWDVQETGCGCCSKSIEVTFWQPLPPPPEDK